MVQEAGCSRIIGVDTNPDKEKRARDMGITDFVNPKDIKVALLLLLVMLLLTAAAAQEGDTLEGTVWQTNGTGLDYTFECIGNTKASCDV